MINKNDLNIIQYSSLLELGTKAGEAIKLQKQIKARLKKLKVNKDTIIEVLKQPLYAQAKFLDLIESFGGFLE